MAKRHLTLAEIDRICSLYREGKSADFIASEFLVHKNTVYAVLERSGVTRRRPRRGYLAETEIQQIRWLYEKKKLSYQSIAEKLNLSVRTVEKYARRAGIVSRPAGSPSRTSAHLLPVSTAAPPETNSYQCADCGSYNVKATNTASDAVD